MDKENLTQHDDFPIVPPYVPLWSQTSSNMAPLMVPPFNADDELMEMYESEDDEEENDPRLE
ncbi:MAG: hypothetical protein PHI27_11465 [Eubacteriales bacterium]|nr:hypothetical protein [Eubacteriales bacterium]MDD3882849.1 hypothetical protein [Eubacteriales bacterium]MDD4512115.1 hypothetical protein [Eubacteriales bacterium]